jgi:effector-binding domain-containing protein
MMIGEPRIEQHLERPYVGIRTVVPFKGMFAETDLLFKELRLWVIRQGLEDAGPFFLRYHVIDMEGPMDIEVGFLVAEPQAGDERVKPGVLLAGRYACLTYSGGGLRANRALIEWAKKEGIVWDRQNVQSGDAFRCRYEAYPMHTRLVPRKTKDVELAIKIADDSPERE